MPRSGTAILPLHYGHPPKRLYERMVSLGGILSELIVDKFGSTELVTRFSDPLWFHSFALALGFDWNSSGTTTVLLSALRDYYQNNEGSVHVIGAKGEKLSTMGNQAADLEDHLGERYVASLMNTARDVARVDNNLLQDGFDLYMQFIVTDGKGWSIVQQGLNPNTRLARRYHWNSRINGRIYDDNRSGLSGSEKLSAVLDLSTAASSRNRDHMVEASGERPERFSNVPGDSRQMTLDGSMASGRFLNMDVRIDWKKLRQIYEYSPQGFDDLFRMKGVGRSTIRALSYLSEIISGYSPSFSDPLKFSFALGGKDGIPRPVNYADYDKCILFFSDVLGRKGFRRETDIMIENLARSGLMLR
ncbi:MAG: DUF763 domain-containing protein [Candidatus Thermoplasmatota archaeon]|nr:DUF763 domain-containing protein [Candidatus Thermoplasmatota archaeon]